MDSYGSGGAPTPPCENPQPRDRFGTACVVPAQPDLTSPMIRQDAFELPVRADLTIAVDPPLLILPRPITTGDFFFSVQLERGQAAVVLGFRYADLGLGHRVARTNPDVPATFDSVTGHLDLRLMLALQGPFGPSKLGTTLSSRNQVEPPEGPPMAGSEFRSLDGSPEGVGRLVGVGIAVGGRLGGRRLFLTLSMDFGNVDRTQSR